MDAIEMAKLSAKHAEDKKGRDVLIVELAELTDIADYFVIISGTSERHVRTLSEAVEKGMKESGIKLYSMEGHQEGRWVIIDYQNVVVHIFLESLRELYDIESLWLEAKKYRIAKENTLLEVGYEQKKTRALQEDNVDNERRHSE